MSSCLFLPSQIDLSREWLRVSSKFVSFSFSDIFFKNKARSTSQKWICFQSYGFHREVGQRRRECFFFVSAFFFSLLSNSSFFFLSFSLFFPSINVYVYYEKKKDKKRQQLSIIFRGKKTAAFFHCFALLFEKKGESEKVWVTLLVVSFFFLNFHSAGSSRFYIQTMLSK